MTRYLLDANVFIQAKNLHYGFDFCPAFWAWLESKNAEGLVASVEMVGEELEGGEDELAQWVAAKGDGFFLRPDEAVLPALTTVSNWATGAGYQPSAVNTFLQVADYWLVAHALAHGCIVVTHEVPADSTKKVKIPNACVGVRIRSMTPYAMLRRERARFILPGAEAAA